MNTKHNFINGNSKNMDEIDDDEVDLVVTSPPYPMIEMWDDLFTTMNKDIEKHLNSGSGMEAFEIMHEELEPIWDEIKRVLTDGGIACINIGDTTRTVDDSFRVYQNHSKIIDYFDNIGFELLPTILWKKPTNSGAKFMGSGMIPPNAYVTLEHEYILIFRNGSGSRSFEPHSERRYESAYFWEERNGWFSDIWTDINGEMQDMQVTNEKIRDRSAAYPIEIPYRLINMYSVYEDTVLDPFWGTGTTSIAAILSGRNSIGYELNEEFINIFDKRLEGIDSKSIKIVRNRMDNHADFVKSEKNDGYEFKYELNNYDLPCMTKQEMDLQLYFISSFITEDKLCKVQYDRFEYNKN